ncbi:MAG: sulfatase-like hydrolase/transferase [Planctomycetota bacterium]
MKAVAGFCITLFLLVAPESVVAIGVQPPNVILILADDLGARELGCYGHPQHRTPNIDRLAAEGTRLETFYAMPLCTPTRVALMTGQYGFHNGFLGMSNPAFRPPADSPQAEIGNHFTHADLLKSAGYSTAMAGKWQLSGRLPTLVHDTGFDEYRMWAYDHNLPPGIRHPAHEKGGNSNRYWHPSIVENGQYLPTQPDDYGPDFFNQFVIDFARKSSAGQKPFFISYTSPLTHGPHLETPDPDHPGQRLPAGFRSNLEYLDVLMGRLLDALRESELDQTTFVIFIGDNGTAGNGKGTLTELGARVPCIIRGPGIRSGVVSNALADLTDILPTLAEIAGAKLPPEIPFDGRSLLPLLKGETTSHREWIYSHLDDGRILRDSRWLLEIDKGGRGERFLDCGQSRDGTGYVEVDPAENPEAATARRRFTEILSGLPQPKPNPTTATQTKTPNDKSPSDPASPPIPARFIARDQNRDGAIDPDEFTATAINRDPAATAARFQKFDTNNDRKISLEEFRTQTK